MQYTRTENQPRTTASPRFSTNGFESVLPPGALDELLGVPNRNTQLGKSQNKHRRPPPPPPIVVIPPAPPLKPHGWVGFLGYGTLIALPIAGLILLISLSTKSSVSVSSWRPSSTPAAAQAGVAPLATPKPASAALPPGWNADGTASGRAGVIPEVRRAELVREPTVRRAELVDIPIGTTGPVIMPDGHQMFVIYRGTVPSFDQLTYSLVGATCAG